MIQLTSAQLDAWIMAFLYPATRILALLSVAPPFNNPALTTRIRLILGLAITVAIMPTLPPIRGVQPATFTGLLVLAEQMLIGFSMGFVLRLVFAAIDMAGFMIGNQAGLGFATAYDPQNTAQTQVTSEFLGILALLLFLAIDGHLMVIAIIANSFAAIPVGIALPTAGSWKNIANAGSVIFSSGIFLSLPIVVTLLIGNIAVAILGRVAPQLNLMAIGFPITIVLGFATLLLGMSYLGAPLRQLFEFGLLSMNGFFVIR